MRMAVAGIGKMGAVLAARLLEVGHEVAVCNRTPDKAKAVAGATAMATPSQLAQYCEAEREFTCARTRSQFKNRRNMSVITLTQASTIVDAALKKGRDSNLAPLTVAVLDAGGHLVAFKREDKSGILRFDIAFGKAWGALGMGSGSRSLASRAAKTPQFFTMLAAASGGRMITNPGGVLIKDGGGDILGACGVSGDVSDKDEMCAIAGIEAAGLKADAGAD